MSKALHTGAVPKFITSHYLEKILQNFFKETSIKVKSYEASRGSSVGDNYIGQILRVEVEYFRNNQCEKISIIVKSVPQTPLSLEMRKHFDVVKTELKMMSETLPLMYKELQIRTDSAPFFPYVYYSDIENGVIFLEDLKADGYVVADRKLSLDLSHSLLVIKTMAKMHASGFLLLQKFPDLRSDYLGYYWKNADVSFPGKIVDGSYSSYLLKFLHLWPISENDKNIFRSYKGKLSILMDDCYRMRESSFNVLIHGDCWTTNMMFKYEERNVKSVKFLDYQLSNYNSIALDIVYFLFTSTKPYVKIEHLEDIIQTYYDTFVSVTGEIEGFSIDTVWKEFAERLPFGFVHAATLRWMMVADEGFDLDAFFEKRACAANDDMFSNKECISEFVNILPIFKKYGVFKSID